jgi:DNA polymerase III subunit delta'
VVLDAAGGQPQAALAWHRAGLDAVAWRQFPRWAERGESQPVAAWPLPVLVDALARLCHDRVRVSVGEAARFFPDAALPRGDVQALLRWSAALRRHARVADHPYSAALAAEALMLEARSAGSAG